ncbi:MAG: glycosyltransferase family 39 protein [Chloroflexi bacterium]|nr:glycosyltransferase family 39 protein [Chloroflexota bacterium]
MTAFMGWIRRHPDLAMLLLVVLVAGGLRAAFLYRAPVFATGDSEGYLAPAYALARGNDLELSSKRTPAYPAFVGFAIAAGGEDLRSVVFLQHLLGVATAGLTVLLGRLCFPPARLGRLVGVVAGLLAALDGALVLVEHSIMTEALFVPLVVGAMTALVAALRHAGGRRSRLALYALAGLLVGAATLTRPVAQALVPLIPLGALLVSRSWRHTFVASAVGIGAFGLLLLPWLVRSATEHDAASVGSLGQSLVGRTARHDRGAWTYYDPTLHANEPPDRLMARKILQQAADNGSSGKAIHTRLRRELGISPAEADRLMRDLAIEAILRRPGYYLQGTLQRFFNLADGSVERLRDYRNTADTARQRWEDEGSGHLLVAATPAEDAAAPTGSALVSLWQPGYVGPILPLLALLGTLAALVRRRWRPAVVVGLASVTLLFVSAAIVGNVARYRFPVDPLVAVLAAGAVTWLVEHVRLLVTRHLAVGAHRSRESTEVPIA